MRALVVYESMYGATRDVARAIADGLGSRLAVTIAEVADAPARLPAGATLLVVGGPTHARGMTKAASRAEAVERAGHRALVSRGGGIREWLAALEATAGQRAAGAAFDTRFGSPSPLWGSAARDVAARLAELGFARAVDPASFLVLGPESAGVASLLPGELERARAWGVALAETVGPRAG
jgi:hypothetical protein